MGQEFTDIELNFARRQQPMLRLLELAYGDGRGQAVAVSQAEVFSLTQREHKILQPLGKGLTGVSIGHLLSISPRKVAKDLEHPYGYARLHQPN